MSLGETIISWITSTGVKIVIAIAILIISFIIINKLAKVVSKKLLANEKFDITLTKTITHIAVISLKVIVIVCLVGFLGIETSGISAVIGSFGVCIGLAVNGTLSNLAGGILILITRPFKLGDYISAQGNEGTVADIKICYTKIKTVDNKIVYLPNSGLSTGTIVNYSEDDLRRVDIDLTIGENDPGKVKNVLLKICGEEKLVLNDPAPFARLTDFGGEKGVVVTLRAWCRSEDYWDARYNLFDRIHKTFKDEGISIPYDRLDVLVKNA